MGFIDICRIFEHLFQAFCRTFCAESGCLSYWRKPEIHLSVITWYGPPPSTMANGWLKMRNILNQDTPDAKHNLQKIWSWWNRFHSPKNAFLGLSLPSKDPLNAICEHFQQDRPRSTPHPRMLARQSQDFLTFLGCVDSQKKTNDSFAAKWNLGSGRITLFLESQTHEFQGGFQGRVLSICGASPFGFVSIPRIGQEKGCCGGGRSGSHGQLRCTLRCGNIFLTMTHALCT